MSLSPRTIAFTAVALILAALAAVRFLPSRRLEEPAANPQAVAPAATTPVTIYDVRPQRMAETLVTSGTLRANESIEVTSQISGKVREVFFEEGRRVATGDLLVKLDDAELLAQLDRAKVRVELAASREQQQRRLLDEGILSQEEYDRQLNEKNVLEAEKRVIEAQLEKTEVRAPFGGTLGLRSISQGAYISPQTRITTLQDISPIKLDFALPEKYAGLVRVGRSVSFQLRGDDRPRSARIYAVEPSVDPATRTLQLRAESPNPDGSLLPGAFADVQVVVRENPTALAVPAIAVVPELGGKKVYVIVNGVAEERAVETGMRNEELVEVVSGLAAGDRVVTSGLLDIKPGATVEVRGEPN